MDKELIVIFGSAIILSILLTVLFSMGYDRKETECKEKCEEFDLNYTHYDGGAFRSDVCWCFNHKTKQPTQIY